MSCKCRHLERLGQNTQQILAVDQSPPTTNAPGMQLHIPQLHQTDASGMQLHILQLHQVLAHARIPAKLHVDIKHWHCHQLPA